MVLGPVDEVAHDQEITGEAHLEDDVDFKFQPGLVRRPLQLALALVRVKLHQAVSQALVRSMAEVLLDAQLSPVDLRGRVVGQLGLTQRQGQAAALRNGHAVGQCRGHVGKQLGHLGRRLEILLTGELARTAGIGQDFPLGNAHPGLVGLVIVRGSELHRVGGHHGQIQARSQLHRRLHMGLIVGTAGTLQLDVETMREGARHLERNLACTVQVVLKQRLAQRSGLSPGEQHQALVMPLNPTPFQDRLLAHHI